ncbi:hypothetical protein BDW22DRAFT_815872 [Trametopsis cervina]|nr:hypothetical protein BDW22DRAFT_815872 [Trametopsis cervina]
MTRMAKKSLKATAWSWFHWLIQNFPLFFSILKENHVNTSQKFIHGLYASLLPCIHFCLADAYLRLSVSFFGEDVFVHHFTDYLSLCGPGDLQYLRGHVVYIAKILELVSMALEELRQYYAALQPRSEEEQDLMRFIANPTRRGAEPGLAGLKFRRRISSRVGKEPEVDMPAMWEGLYEGKRVLIKFTECYSVRAHRILADCERPKAPKLYFAERLLGGVWMVVMEYLGGQDADRKFGSKALPGSVVGDIEDALKLLHEQNIVFGDLQRQNIMVNVEGGRY